ncbi:MULTISPECIES: S1 RNA-binding domain-containing protein [Brevibacillus]|uniref:RNA-binding protein S1 n=1 Tax=Brevibacillus laterosporus TaxID=1465 RepID=A0A2S5HI38_BRELA|nr:MULTISPECIES: S1 RNA-binding domain-containing protein [Brevibacillus]QOS97927.1 S1 RNA-binding domain-containing protein [Brevibacterium sp. JNUCC-42]ATO48966.1 RNA-binding protein S1 [Brevibacillus laterosporus DSM 25]AYB40949.1 S1 RNA-binding domain-containing protein [Brevibacillus laterosporus]MBG9775547.1 RNA-binding protein [Brevibacillus laterosporus]MBG9790095.1 RNA-binding protein [Brevibacillus laterosporus]
MAVEVGSIIEGKVTAIKPFGMFVAVDETQQGLVHISQVANGFVKDINDHFSVGAAVKVKVLSIDDAGKISLSVRAALPAPEREARDEQKERGGDRGGYRGGGNRGGDRGFNKRDTPKDSFEDKMKKWMKHSEENIATINKKQNKRGY